MGHGVVMMAVRLPARPSVCPTVRLVVVTSMDSHKRLREEKVKEEEEDVLPPPRKRPTFRRAIEMAKREDGVETVQEYFELFDSDDEEDEEKEDSEMNAIFRVAAGHGRDDTVKYLIGDNPGLVELDVKERNIGEEEEEEEEEEEKNGDDDDDNLTALEQAAKHAGAANVVELLLGHGGYSDAIKVSALQQAAKHNHVEAGMLLAVEPCMNAKTLWKAYDAATKNGQRRKARWAFLEQQARVVDCRETSSSSRSGAQQP